MPRRIRDLCRRGHDVGDGPVRASGCHGCGVARVAPCGAPNAGDGDCRRRSPCARLGGAGEHLDRHGQWAGRPLNRPRSRVDSDRRGPRTLALARALSRRSRRRGGRSGRPRCSRRGSDRGRRGRSMRRAHARLDRAVAPQLDCTAAARHRARSLVAPRRSGRGRSRPAAGAGGSERPCAGHTPRSAIPWNQAGLDRPSRHGFEFTRCDGRATPRRNPTPKSRTQPNPDTPRHASKPAAKQATRSHPAPVQKHSSRSIWFYVVAALLLVLLILAVLIAARLLSTRFAWGRVRRRLAAGAPADQITGAWAWTRMRLEACRLPLSVDLSPDLVVARHALLAGELKLVAEELAEHGYPTADVPTDVYTPLQALAATTTTAAFAREQSLGAPEVADAWTAADKAYESARELLSRSGRALLAFRGPALAALSEDEDAARPRRRHTTTQAAIIMAASGLVLCFAILAGRGKGAVPTVSTPTKPATAEVSTSAPTVRAPTTPRHAPVSPAPAPSANAPGARGLEGRSSRGRLGAPGNKGCALGQGAMFSGASAHPDARARRHGPAGGDPAEGACGARPFGGHARWQLRAGYADGRREVPGLEGVAPSWHRRAPNARGVAAGAARRARASGASALPDAHARRRGLAGEDRAGGACGAPGNSDGFDLESGREGTGDPQAQAPSQTLAPGDTGPQVTILQRALAALGLSAGTPDGNYGPATQTAVARFQASKGLPQVGIVGPQTLAALEQALSRRSRR